MDARNIRPLGFWSVVALVFFEVAGGPFGIEDTVRYGGSTLALLGLMVLPVIWSIPEALVTAELGTMFPEDSGFVAWVTAAFGPFWGFQEGFLSWMSGVMDNSIYPLFLVRYLKWFFPILNRTVPFKRLFVVVVSAGMTYLNYRGLKVVGRMAVALTIFIMLPFVVLTFAAVDDINPSKWVSIPNPESINYVEFINVMFWNLNYWDSVSTLGGEIGDIRRVLPRALLTAVLLVSLGYLVPILVGVGVLGAKDWPEGFFGFLGHKVGGVWLEGWITLAAVASQMGLFTAELTSDAYLLLGLSEKGMLPKCLSYKSKHGTPTIALLLSCSGMVVMLITFDFISIVEMLNIVYCFAEILEFCACIQLRRTMPDYPRPFKIPLGIHGLVFMLFPSSIFALGILMAPFVTLDWGIMGFTLGSLIIGIVLYYLLEHLRNRGSLRFNKPELLGAVADYQQLSEDETDMSGRRSLEVTS